MCSLQAVGSLLNRDSIAPLSKASGATSKSDPDAGSTAAKDPTTEHAPITTGDKAGATILTIIVVFLIVGGSIWLVI